MTVVPADRIFRTVNLQIQFLRLGRAHDLLIEARIISQTRQLISCRVEFRRADGELIAEATGQQLVVSAQ
jgi:acyl-coenzyme A thioesterase PaaI-like protein